MLAEPAFSTNELPDQALAGGDVGVALDVERALRVDLPAPVSLLHPLPQLGVLDAQHIQEPRLAQQEFVFGVFLHQRQLVGVGAADLVPGLLLRPEPGQVDMALPQQPHGGRSGAVAALQRRTQHFPRPAEALMARLDGQLEIRRVGEVHQGLGDLLIPQGLFVQLTQQVAEHLHIQVELIGILIPYREDALSHRALAFRHRRDGRSLRRAGAHVLQPRAMPGVAFDQHTNPFTVRAGLAQGDVIPPLVVGAAGDAIHID